MAGVVVYLAVAVVLAIGAVAVGVALFRRSHPSHKKLRRLDQQLPDLPQTFNEQELEELANKYGFGAAPQADPQAAPQAAPFEAPQAGDPPSRQQPAPNPAAPAHAATQTHASAQPDPAAHAHAATAPRLAARPNPAAQAHAAANAQGAILQNVFQGMDFPQAAKLARKNAEDARRAYWKNVEQARIAVKHAENANAQCEQRLQQKISQELLLAQCAGLKLYPSCLVGEDASFALSPNISFEFNMSGGFVYEREGERERAVDKRTLYITVSAPEGCVTVETSAANELAARQFANAVHNATLHQDEHLKMRDAKLKGLHGYYADKYASAAAVESARRALRAAEANTAPIAAADSILAGLMAQATPEDLKRLKRADRAGTAGIVVLTVVLGLIVCVAAIFAILLVYGLSTASHIA